MNPAFQEGRRPAANTTASLANTGHPSPLSRRAGAGTMHTASVGTTGRSGPRPMSAQQISKANASQSHMKRTVDQVVQLTKEESARLNAQLRRRMELMPYSTYDARKVDRNSKVTAVDTNGEPTGKERYVVGQLWVYASTLNDAENTRRYWVYNTQTNVLISFEPERGVSAGKRTYMSEKDRFRNTAAGTGVAGGYMEKGFIVIAGGALTGGLLWEAGLAGVIGTAIRAYVVDASKKVVQRIIVDLGGQFGVGLVTSSGSFEERAITATRDINWSSALAAGMLNTDGLNRYAKLLAAFGTSVSTNAYTVKINNVDKYGSFGHVVNLQDEEEKKEFTLSVICGTVFDQVKEYGAPLLEKLGRNTPNTMGMMTALKYNRYVKRPPSKVVSQTQVAVLSFQIGGALETGKKFWEMYKAEKKKTDDAAKNKAPSK